LIQYLSLRLRGARFAQNRRFLSAILVTTLLLGVIAFLPTAQAVEVEIIGLENGQKLTFGGTTSFTIKVSINTDERIPIDEIRVIIDGQTLRFQPGGIQITNSPIIPSLGAPIPDLSSLFGYYYGFGSLYGYGYTFPYGYAVNTGPAYSSTYGYGYGYGFAGPLTFTMNAVLNQGHLAVGAHQIRVDILTGLTPRDTFSSATISFEVLPPPPTAPPPPPPPPPGLIHAVEVTSSNPSVDATQVAGVLAKFTNLGYGPGARGEVRIVRIVGTPTTAVTVEQGTGNQPVRFVDVQVVNIVRGSAEITVSYDEAQLGGVKEETLTLHYYNAAANRWVELSNIKVDTVNNTVTGTIDVAALSGTIIAISGKTLALESVIISGQGTTIEVLTGEPVTFTATATMTDGTPAASATIIPLQNNVTLAPILTGRDGRATFTLVITKPGTYEIKAQGTLDRVIRTSPAATLKVLSRDMSAALIAETTNVQPGQSIRVKLELRSEALLKQGTVTFLTPIGTTASNVTTEGFPSDVTIVGNVVTIRKPAVTPASRSATISLTLTASIQELKPGQRLIVTATADIDQLTTVFTTDSKIVLTITKPTVSSIFSVLDSFFQGRPSTFTENRIPRVKDIFTLLDLFFEV